MRPGPLASDAVEGIDELGSLNAGIAYTALALAALAAGDAATALNATRRPADTQENVPPEVLRRGSQSMRRPYWQAGIPVAARR